MLICLLDGLNPMQRGVFAPGVALVPGYQQTGPAAPRTVLAGQLPVLAGVGQGAVGLLLP